MRCPCLSVKRRRNAGRGGLKTAGYCCPPFDLHDAVYINAGRDNRFRVDITECHDFVYGRNSEFGGARHHRPKVTGRLAIHQITPAVAAFSLDQRNIPMQGFLEDIVPAVDLTRFAVACKLGSVPGGAEEAADTGACSAYTLCKRTLRNQLKLDFPSPVEFIEHVGIGLPRETAHNFSYFAGF